MSEKHVTTLTDPDALPQLIGDYLPADHWQVHINKIFYALRGNQLRDFYQTFASTDLRLAHALAAHYYSAVKAREFGTASGSGQVASGKPGSRPHSVPGAPSPDLVIHEWGCGNGNLAACFLSHLKAIAPEDTDLRSTGDAKIKVVWMGDLDMARCLDNGSGGKGVSRHHNIEPTRIGSNRSMSALDNSFSG